MKKDSSSQNSAFTLVELLVVMGIIVLMGALIVPAVSGTLKGTAINQASQTILAQFNSAQQIALAKGQTIELRLIMAGDIDAPATANTGGGDQDESWRVRGVQTFSVSPSFDANIPLNYTPITKLEFFPNSIIIDKGPKDASSDSNNRSSLSTLCVTDLLVDKDAADYQHPALPRVGKNYKYYAVQFNADGTTNLDPNKSWYLTLHNLTSGDRLTQPPSNYFTVSLDPVQGSTRVFRP